MKGKVVPNLPLFTNTFYPPNQPSAKRCFHFGEIVGKAIASWDSDLRVAVFGSDDARAGGLADDLGVALQLTNILRDVREDAARGRTYLPAEDLVRFGAPSGDTATANPPAPPPPSGRPDLAGLPPSAPPPTLPPGAEG